MRSCTGVGRVTPCAASPSFSEEVASPAAYGSRSSTAQHPTRPDTLFDLASVSKLYTVAAFMSLVEARVVSLDQSVCSVLPDLTETRPIQPYEDPLSPGDWVHVGAPGYAAEVDARQVTFRHLLAHNSGLPAWRPLFREAGSEAARRMATHTFFSYPTGARVLQRHHFQSCWGSPSSGCPANRWMSP
jgi:CubicO group peptidase (beta-lactamase class C family)